MDTIDLNKIKKLIESDITAYKIAQETGLSNTIIGQLKNGDKGLKSLTIKNAIKLERAYENLLVK